MSARRCSQCGASVEIPDGVRSATCAFCDSALVDDAGAEAGPVADKVVPFVIPRERAATLLREFLASRWLAPESIRKASRADELNDVLVPFYAFDAVARSTFSARIGVYWYRTETYTTRVNGRTVVRTRQVRETEWFPLEGSHVRQWFDHLVSASRGIPERDANALEPFDLGQALPFAPALIAGVSSERPTVPHAEAAVVARQELANLEQRVIASTHLPGDTHSGLSSHTVSDLSEARLVLLPVWIAVVKAPTGPLRLLVNGQTGEVVGDVPRSGWKIAMLVMLVLLLLGAVASAFAGVGALGALLKALR